MRRPGMSMQVALPSGCASGGASVRGRPSSAWEIASNFWSASANANNSNNAWNVNFNNGNVNNNNKNNANQVRLVRAGEWQCGFRRRRAA